MQDLHLIGVHEDGEHLLLGDDSGGQFRLRLDEALRRAARHETRPSAEAGAAGPAPLGPREVQAMIRAGASAQEAAERAGWSIEKVHRFDGPILAERGHIASLAARTRLRGRYGEPGSTLAERVTERLHARGAADQAAWDSWRSEDGHWTVVLRFSAGGRAREASWAFSRQGGSLHPLDDEALWLSAEDEPESPIPRRHRSAAQARLSAAQHDGAEADEPQPHGDPRSGRQEDFDRAEDHGPTDGRGHAGGRDQAQGRGPGRVDPAGPGIAHPAPAPSPGGRRPRGETAEGAEPTPAPAVPFEIEEREDAFDLMDSVRQRSTAARRRGGAGRRPPRVDAAPGHATSPSALPSAAGVSGDAALPLADLGYDPETMEPPPGAHSDPQPAGVDGRPEPAAAEAATRRRQPKPRRATRVAPPRAGREEAPTRVKRRRPAAFPGALDPDPAPDDDLETTDAIAHAATDDKAAEASVQVPELDATAAEEDWIETAVAEGPTTPADAPADSAPSAPGASEAEAEPTADRAADGHEEPHLPWDEGDERESEALAAAETFEVETIDSSEDIELSDGMETSEASGAGASLDAPAPGDAREASQADDIDTESPSPATDDGGQEAARAQAPKATGPGAPSRGGPKRPAGASPEAEPPASPASTPAAKRRARTKGRASVPSWDDIMFGSRRE